MAYNYEIKIENHEEDYGKHREMKNLKKVHDLGRNCLACFYGAKHGGNVVKLLTIYKQTKTLRHKTRTRATFPILRLCYSSLLS